MKLSSYLQPIKTFLWGVAGVIVSLYMINNPIVRVTGYLLLTLSLLMFVLVIYQTLKVKN